MKKLMVAGLVAIAVAALAAAPGEAWYRSRGGVFVSVGPWYWPGAFGPYWYPSYGPYAYGPYAYGPYGYGPYSYPSLTVVDPPVYIERLVVPPPPPSPPPEYWYYCRGAGAYYPEVQTCPEEWVKVPPRAPG